MKPVSEALKLETQGLDNEQREFKINQSQRMFEILSSAIYKDKPLAVLREYGCNAWDAHIAAGTDDRPFDVHLPNSFEPYFSIRDYGTGLSHDSVMEIYTTYGLSTKTGENKSVGMLGLGSKSAFAYNDQFTITSIFQGVERIYSAFLNADGIPTITMINEEKTQEPNGLEIHIAVKSEDFSTFANRAQDVFFRFPVQPNITGNVIDLDQVEYSLVKEYFKLRNENHGHCVAVQGTVAYPISARSFSEGMLTGDQNDFLRSVPIDFIFPIGTLDIAASREDLNYNKATQEAIIGALNKALEELPRQFDDLLTGCKTLWEAKTFYRNWLKNQEYVVKTILKATNKKIMWRDIEMTDHSGIRIEMFDKVDRPDPQDITKTIEGFDFWKAECQVWDYSDLQPNSKHGAPRFESTVSVEVSDASLVIFVDKRFKAPTRSMRELFCRYGYHNNGKIYVFRNYTEEEFEKITSKLDGMPIENVKFLSEYKEPLSPKMKAEIRKIFKPWSFNSYGPEMKEVERDVADGGKYLLLYSGSLMGTVDKQTDQRFAKILYNLRSFEHEIDPELFFINYSHKGIADNPGWVNYHDELKARVLNIVLDKKVRNAYAFFAQLKHSRRFDTDLFKYYLKFVDQNYDALPRTLKFPYELAKKHSDVLNAKFNRQNSIGQQFDTVDTFLTLCTYANGVYDTGYFDYEGIFNTSYLSRKMHRLTNFAPLFIKMLSNWGSYRSAFTNQDIIDYVNFYKTGA